MNSVTPGSAILWPRGMGPSQAAVRWKILEVPPPESRFLTKHDKMGYHPLNRQP